MFNKLIDNFENVESTMAWMCWALPLFVTEIVLQVPKIYEEEG